jgi:asparagine synthase (glutamine-hydrolysing)
MCRIVGIASSKPLHVSESLIVSLRDSMSHGGPDDAGIYIDRNVALANRRLSIIDLSQSGHQPMSSEDKKVWITYNGEIYNFKELRSELQKLGYNFNSNSDTEVIIKAYEEWGESSFLKLNGMFAFCIYDKRKEQLYLVRDHAGMKPLYYSFFNGTLLFSSEMKIFKLFNNSFDENSWWKIYFLLFGYIPGPYTTLKNVFMLPGGAFLRIDLKTWDYKIRSFANFTFSEKIKKEKDAIEFFRDEFVKAVERHLISDAPLGVFLSGGIDSSLISLIASRFISNRLITLSVVFNEKDYSEEKYQNLVINKINSKHIRYLVTESDFINCVENILSAIDQPTIDGINTYFISRCARETGLKTVLSGLGGDELFGGYPSFQLIKKLWFYKPYELNGNRISENFMKNLKQQNFFYNLFGYSPVNKLKKISFLALPSPLSYYLFFRGIFTLKETREILGTTESEISSALSQLLINGPISQFGELPSYRSLNFASMLEIYFYMQNQLLKDTDFMSMWHSVETRLPFLDKKVMEIIFSIAEKVKFQRGFPKEFLVKTYKDILPEEIARRKKMTFSFPFQEWMRKNLFYLTDFIHDRNKTAVKKIIDNFNSNRLHWSRFWGLVILNKKL